MAGARARRLAPEERRVLLIEAATETFAERGYTQAGLADVAALAGVSKTLLYHYFPDGRPELYREVMERLAGELLRDVRTAVATPGPGERRLAELVRALVTYFEDRPDAYRLLILEPWGSGDAGIVAQAAAVRTRLAGELGGLLAATGESRSVAVAGGTAVLGAVLSVCEVRTAGRIGADDALDVAQRFAVAGLRGLGLL